MRICFLSAADPFTVNSASYQPSPATNPKAAIARIVSDGNAEWSEAANVHEFPTDAFGDIQFVNEDEGSLKPSKYIYLKKPLVKMQHFQINIMFRYIRISDKTSMDKVRELLVDHWGILKPRRPHLALSLIGGAKNFRMEGKKKETFKRGLIEAAKSTNALILTAGTNTGTMKLVGEAVRTGQFMVTVS